MAMIHNSPAIVAQAGGTAASADLILFNGRIKTLDRQAPEGHWPQAPSGLRPPDGSLCLIRGAVGVEGRL